MVVLSPCKINIGLRILYKRNDGFHELESIFYPVQFCDILEIVPAKSFYFESKGLSISGNTEHNLCVKAYQLLKEQHQLGPVHMYLHKNIPTGAGLGGGSANAAYTLLMLNKVFQLKLKKSELLSYASHLGSDCPFFIHKRPKYVRGRGEKIKSIQLDLSTYYIYLVFPGISISTKEAFSGLNLKTKKKTSISKEIILDITQWKEHLVNDFEESIFLNYPILNEIKQKLYQHGAVYASLSGSGSCIYGIFKQKPEKIAFQNNELFTEKIVAL